MITQGLAFRQAYGKLGGLARDVIGEFYVRRVSARRQQSIADKHHHLAERYRLGEESQTYPYHESRARVWRRCDMDWKHLAVPAVADLAALAVVYWDADLTIKLLAISSAMRVVRIGHDIDNYRSSREEYLDVVAKEAESGTAQGPDKLTILAMQSRLSANDTLK